MCSVESAGTQPSYMADNCQQEMRALPPPAVEAFDDEEFPFAHGALNGIKCCTKCGATKTPQWREGPFGPKTLCNACGVKRTRKLRAEQEGGKRRKLSTSPAPPALKHACVTAAPKHATSRSGMQYLQDVPSLDRYGSLEPDSEAWGLPAGGARRPPRRAAEEAAFRTALYARTGEWAEGQNEEGGPFEGALHAATPSSSDGYSLPSSNCPEEVSWPPLGGDTTRGSDCYAAINLMTMSANQAAHALTAVAAATSSGIAPGSTPDLGGASASPASPALHFDPEQLNHDSLVALVVRYGGTAGACAAPHPHRVTPVDLADLSQCLPPAKVLELVRLNQELEMALHEAHAANAAVAAVAQVLASKQAVALRSREVAGAATKRLRRFMSELDMQFGIQSKFGSRWPPLSPTKPTTVTAAAAPRPAPAGATSLSPVPPVLAPRLPAAPALAAGML